MLDLSKTQVIQSSATGKSHRHISSQSFLSVSDLRQSTMNIIDSTETMQHKNKPADFTIFKNMATRNLYTKMK